LAIPYLACMALVANLYALPPRVLPSIQAVEGGRPGVVHANPDGSEDLGVMQINTRWLPAFAAYTATPVDVVRDRLVNRPCYNIAASGAIMRMYLTAERGDLIKAVGDYHSHTDELNKTYRARVIRSALHLFQNGAPQQNSSLPAGASPSAGPRSIASAVTPSR
jgi:hypothetical protein